MVVRGPVVAERAPASAEALAPIGVLESEGAEAMEVAVERRVAAEAAAEAVSTVSM